MLPVFADVLRKAVVQNAHQENYRAAGLSLRAERKRIARMGRLSMEARIPNSGASEIP
jgi:hypothetical protein